MIDEITYKPFLHVERLDDSKVNVAEYINTGNLYCFAKIDGTNSSVWATNGKIHCGSRKREITAEKDNANFYKYITESTDPQIDALRRFCLKHEGLIVFGEFIGGVEQTARFIGSIKTYLTGGFYIFAVFDIARGDYVPYPEYAPLFEGVYDKVLTPLAVLHHPNLEDIQALVDKNHFNLPDNEIGEGIVIYHYGYRDQWKNSVICKIVRSEYKEAKSKSKKEYTVGEIEQEFVDTIITSAFMDKCRNKVCQMLDIDEFDTSNSKQINIFLNLLVSDSIDEDIYTFVKKKHFPTINFGHLKGCIMMAGRKFLGLV